MIILQIAAKKIKKIFYKKLDGLKISFVMKDMIKSFIWLVLLLELKNIIVKKIMKLGGKI